jgi:hypothetical protein
MENIHLVTIELEDGMQGRPFILGFYDTRNLAELAIQRFINGQEYSIKHCTSVATYSVFTANPYCVYLISGLAINDDININIRGINSNKDK